MSDHIPFEIQSEIIKCLPVKSLLQFRTVSKQWKSFIDSPEFIKNYHINRTNPQYHLFVSHKLYRLQRYTSIIDNNTFPQHRFPLTAPESLDLLIDKLPLCSAIDGLLCFFGLYGGDRSLRTRMAVIWNPSLRKSVSVGIIDPDTGYNVVGFGVCPDTSDPKLVKISVVDMTPSMWEVEVFTLSTRVWKTVYTGAPFKPCDLTCLQAFVDGVIYFRAYDDFDLGDGVRSNFVISFDLTSEKFGEVCLPERLVHTLYLDVAKVNESLGLLEYYDEGEMTVCGVWTRKDGANKLFTKIYTVKVEGMWLLNRVLGFRNNGEAVMDVVDDDTNEESEIEVYEPLSGHTNGIGINGKPCTFSARSYMETLLLLDQSDSIIH